MQLPLPEAIKDPEFLISDFAKFDRPAQLHLIWQAFDAFYEQKKFLPRPYNEADAGEMLFLCEKLNAAAPEKTRLPDIDKDLVRLFSFQVEGNLIPITGFIGGIAAQEAMKGMTSIFTPIRQWFYFDALECLPDSDSPFKLNKQTCSARGSRYDGQVVVFGWPFQEALLRQKWFIVGAGAIGCELLKYFAHIGVACGPGGCLFLTDMDSIETSNLNRQFLFHRQDVGSKKSEVAAKAAKSFNPALNIKAMCDRVGGDTEQIFNDSFFENLDGVTNALDNVEARTYMDRRCVYYRLPLVESGTQGAKGNVQVVYPYLTESYSSSQDPPEKSIPICTLKNFPNAIEHTIQWARDLFEGLFTIPAELANQFLDDPRGFFERVDKMHAGQKAEMLASVKRVLIDDRPSNAEQCITWARMRWEENFNWQIRQLLHNFPADQVTLQGAKFWSGSKRCPHPLTFDANDPTHTEFVYSASILRAQMYNIIPIVDLTKVVEIATAQQPPPFVPKSGVRIAINDQEAQQAAQNGVEGKGAHRWQSDDLSRSLFTVAFRRWPLPGVTPGFSQIEA
ncbi:unnamed protein product [Soboliphyme baturini]|uniref:E1 ubiquitin-activating enzyme n=1 Tax=Soboliphyme baturini TaxID=241478 RepID=A0A3P8DNF5_9BILA|nr:unnamed protein product [Soboliphyme baturini]